MQTNQNRSLTGTCKTISELQSNYNNLHVIMAFSCAPLI